MKKYIILLLIILFPLYNTLMAFDWTEDELEEVSKKEEIKVISKSNTDTGILVTLQDEANHVFEVSYRDRIEKDHVKNIILTKDTFFNWQGLDISKLEYSVENSFDNLIKISVLPSRYVCNGTNIISYLPAGMTFTYTDALQYNFRLTKDKLFLRITGYFINQKEFNDKLTEALKNPSAYIKKRDPEYFLSKLDILQDEMDKMRRANSFLRWAVIALITDENLKQKDIDKAVELKKQNPAWTISQIRDKLDEQGIELSKKEINVILAVYFNEYQD